MPKTCAVIIGDHNPGLGILRSAAVTGGEVWVVCDKSLILTRFSKYLTGYQRIRRGTLGQLHRRVYADHLLKALLALPIEYPSLLFGAHEDIISFIYRYSTYLRQKFFIPRVRYDVIYDKYEFNQQLPDSMRIDTYLWRDFEIGTIQDPHLFIVKGRQGNAFRRLTGEKAIQLDCLTRQETDRINRELLPDQLIVQRTVNTDRPVVSVCALSVRGKMMGVFQYEKLRQHPNRFGTGTYLRSTRIESLTRIAEEILGKLGFTGISEIEFIFDPEGGGYRVIEMNPRAWKSVHFATQCGQNLVARYLTYVATGQIDRDDDYASDCYWADLASDLPQMIRERRLFGYHRGFFECVWDKSDPGPALALWTLFPVIAIEERFSALLGSWMRDEGEATSEMGHSTADHNPDVRPRAAKGTPGLGRR